MGATLSAGLSLNWVREVMNASWAELYASAGHPGRIDDPIFVPHLSGERTPYCDPALRGSWTALSLAGDRASLLRCALEGIAFAIRDALDALLGEPYPASRASGARRGCGWRAEAPWPRAGGSCSRTCWGCRCTRWTCPRRPAGARPCWAPTPPAC